MPFYLTEISLEAHTEWFIYLSSLFLIHICLIWLKLCWLTSKTSLSLLKCKYIQWDVDYFGLYRIIIRAVASPLWLISVSTRWLWNMLHYIVLMYYYYCMFLSILFRWMDCFGIFLYIVKQSNTFNNVLWLKCLLFSIISYVCWCFCHNI